MFAGGVAETPDDGAAVGPLFSCIIGNQFRDFKDGDRYWYERRGVEGFSRGKKHQKLPSCTEIPAIKLQVMTYGYFENVKLRRRHSFSVCESRAKYMYTQRRIILSDVNQRLK